MFALIKYGVGCTLSIKHTLLDWSWKLVPRCGLAGSSTSGPVLFCLSCFCMGVHARACRRVAFVRAGHMHARWFRWFRPCMRVGFSQGHWTHAGERFRSGGTRWRAGVHARWFRPGTPDTCRRIAFVRAGRDGARTCMRVVLGRRRGTHAGSLVSAGRDVMARWVGGQVSAGRFRWFRAHFCHRALAAAETNFSARFFFPCLFKHATL